MLAPFHRSNNEVDGAVTWQPPAHSSTPSCFISFTALMTDNCVYSFIFSLSLCSHKFHEELGLFVPLVPCYLPMPRSIPGPHPTKWIKKPPICNCVNIRVIDTLKGKAVTFIMLNSKYLARQMRPQTKWREKKTKKSTTAAWGGTVRCPASR